ncbi:MAG: GNAT family N-acetyltransferase [Candidatus Eisenbacteria bacterium]|nr:GNAT family N-acetyltransferase [Candidatus Eisenbacteria bacterium]
MFLAVEHRSSSTLIGHVGLSPLDDDVEIGFSIAESFQRQGLATEAIDAASHWAFETFALARILAITSATNTASRRTLLRAGFIYEGDKTMRFQGMDEAVSVYARFRRSDTE